MVTRIADRQVIGISDLIDIADETQQLIETTRELGEKSIELENTAQQLREANERWRTLDAQKDEFLSQVSHELRTPMTSIRSFSEILLGTPDITDEERRKFISIIQEESVRLTRLLDEILDISRLEAGSSALELEEINLADAVSKSLDSVSGMVRTLDVTVDTKEIDERLAVEANPDRLRQVLINILSNAVKYNSSEDPLIQVRARDDGKHIWVDIIDNGGGVSREDAEVVFEKFARGSHTGPVYGAGLGLPISRAIMRAMGGDLTIQFAPDNTSYFQLQLIPVQNGES